MWLLTGAWLPHWWGQYFSTEETLFSSLAAINYKTKEGGAYCAAILSVTGSWQVITCTASSEVCAPGSKDCSKDSGPAVVSTGGGPCRDRL